MSRMAKAPQVVLGLVFLGAGGQKLTGADPMVDLFARFRYPPWFRMATGALETAGAAAMLAGLARPALVPMGGVLLGATMTGAVASHLRAGDSGRALLRPAVLFALAVGVSVARLGGSQGDRSGAKG